MGAGWVESLLGHHFPRKFIALNQTPHPPVGKSHVEGAKGSRICQTEDDAGLRYDRDQEPEGIVYELAGKK